MCAFLACFADTTLLKHLTMNNTIRMRPNAEPTIIKGRPEGSDSVMINGLELGDAI